MEKWGIFWISGSKHVDLYNQQNVWLNWLNRQRWLNQQECGFSKRKLWCSQKEQWDFFHQAKLRILQQPAQK